MLSRQLLMLAKPRFVPAIPITPTFVTSFKLPFSTVSDDTEDSDVVKVEKEYESEIKDVWNSYEERKKRKQSKLGVVVSVKNSKTINVEYAYRKYLPKYNVFMTRHKKLHAHDETERAQLGDIVRIVPCRPRSKTKRHELL
eukprot:CAMPEP_0202974402 /NCGR_PEP_ID=MMETSP1396-20130829/60132_1 /ASSEMBLY_ACC=CAM_ASM_000872 /TAXON_ID= /ORGANISM="Pseudokeronopsis sp., Strain Brazil" /LENGTH=140 /DNA_ID=CAMNT_0049708153 /DNA_START=18 /DNA_END=436 /DNA_ORIENTATION=+